MRKMIIGAALALTVLASCGASKNVATTGNLTTTVTSAPATQQERAQAIASSHSSWTTMQTSGSIKLGGSKSFSSSINVRMNHGTAIAISLRPMLGIEVGRLVFTGDSVIVVDRVHRQYIAENVALFTNGLPATVGTLQDIFLGRAFIVGEGTYDTSRADHATATSATGKCVLEPNTRVTGFKYDFTYDEDNNILAFNITPEGATQTVYSVDYSDVKSTQAGKVAHTVGVAGTIKGKPLNFTLSYKDISWGGQVKIDTSIPDGYKRADISSISSILKGE